MKLTLATLGLEVLTLACCSVDCPADRRRGARACRPKRSTLRAPALVSVPPSRGFMPKLKPVSVDVMVAGVAFDPGQIGLSPGLFAVCFRLPAAEAAGRSLAASSPAARRAPGGRGHDPGRPHSVRQGDAGAGGPMPREWRGRGCGACPARVRRRARRLCRRPGRFSGPSSPASPGDPVEQIGQQDRRLVQPEGIGHGAGVAGPGRQRAVVVAPPLRLGEAELYHLPLRRVHVNGVQGERQIPDRLTAYRLQAPRQPDQQRLRGSPPFSPRSTHRRTETGRSLNQLAWRARTCSTMTRKLVTTRSSSTVSI